MCKAIGYIIAAGVLVAPLRGQDVASMGRRVDSVSAAAVRAQEMVLEYRRAHPVRLAFSDSMLIGQGRVRLYFDSALARQVRAGAAVAQPHIEELGNALNLIDTVVFSVVPDSIYDPYDQEYRRRNTLNMRQHFGSEPKPARTSVEPDPQSIAYVLLRVVAGAATGKAPSKIGLWTSGTVVLAPGLDAQTDWAAIRLTMVSSPSHLGRSCFLGDLRACRIFLGIEEVADPMHQWFDAQGRQRRVQYDLERARMYAPIATDRCLSGNDEACISALTTMGGWGILSSPFIRASVVSQALSLGGPRAAERLLTTQGKPADALAAAAGMPIDSLIANWQSHLGERNTTGNIPLTIAISSIVWIALCLFLALRSTRWR